MLGAGTEKDSPLHKLVYGMTEGLETMLKSIREERLCLLEQPETNPDGVFTTINNDAHFNSLLTSKEETTQQTPVFATVREEVIDPSYEQPRPYAANIRTQPPVALVAPTVFPPPEAMEFEEGLTDFDPARVKFDDPHEDDDDIVILDDAEVAAAAAAKAAQVAALAPPPAPTTSAAHFGTPSTSQAASDAGTLDEYFLPVDPAATTSTNLPPSWCCTPIAMEYPTRRLPQAPSTEVLSARNAANSI